MPVKIMISEDYIALLEKGIEIGKDSLIYLKSEVE